MERNFKEALKHRRSYYAIEDKSPVSDLQIEEIIDLAVLHVPSAFNSQSGRVILLLHGHHKKLWEIVKEALKDVVAAPAYATSLAKINKSFASGYGTVLFFEDRAVVEGLQKAFPLYRDKFPEWSLQSAGMQQLAVWTMLEDAGLGASLQHYNPLIDEAVRKEWKLPASWDLLAQMPFGLPLEPPGKKDFKPLDERVKVFK